MNNYLKVAGVTFANDNGTSRQDILALLNNSGNWFIAKLEQTTFEGERAVKVFVNNMQIGWIAKAQLDDERSYNKTLTCFVGKSKSGYYAQLTETIAPSAKEYHTMKAICSKHGLPMPAYDRRAYAQRWAIL